MSIEDNLDEDKRHMSPFSRMQNTTGFQTKSLESFAATRQTSPTSKSFSGNAVKSLMSLRQAMPIPYVAPVESTLEKIQKKNPKALTRGRF